MKDFLFIVCTHGNEPAPLSVIKDIIQKYGAENFHKRCDYVVANPKALEKNVRFIETDLNRIYPGDTTSEKYEARRAAELLTYARQFKYVVDVHTTTANSGIFTLITKETEANYKLACKLIPKKIVLWESTSGRKTGPITSFLDCACEIECSVIQPKYLAELEDTILQAIDATGIKTKGKEWYRVIGSIPKNEENLYPGLKDFSMFSYNGKSLYPLLTGRYSDKVCYLMEKIDDPLQTNTD